MTLRLYPINGKRDLFLRALHLFFAGLYAFVLPFICWGAQATPGHPHARAHFVFVEPSLSAPGGDEAAADEAIVHADMNYHGAHAMAQATAKPDKSPRQPVGRATPSMIGVTILLLIGGAAIRVPCNSEGPGFCYWFAPLAAIPFTDLIPTPPPR